MFGGNFGSSTPTFGGGGFPSSTANTGVFGQPQQQQQPVVSASLFGGGFNQPKSTFGSFGSPQQTNSMFGQQTRLPAPTTGSLFSTQTATVSPFSSTGQTQQVTAGTSIPFNPISGSDTMMKNGQASPISTRHQCITCMKEYETKSLEELRLEDYQLNRKGPQPGGMFGSTQPQQQQSTGLFSSLSSNTVAPFGQSQSTFGAPATSNTNSGWLFSSFGQQPKPATTSFFSSPAPAAATSSAFGTNTAFSFSNQPAQQTSVFGSNNNTIPTLGSTAGPFSFGQQQSQTQSTSLFGQKPLTTAPTTGFGGGFGSSAFTNTSTANKPPTLGFSGFGTSTAPTFGTTSTTNFGSGTTGNMFGGFQSQPQQSKPFSFATPFSSQATPAQPTFGAPNTSGFSFSTAATSAPTMGFGTSTNTFGGGLGNTMNSFSAPTFGAAQPTMSMGGFGFGLNTTSSQPGFSSFGTAPSTMYPQAMPQQQNAPQSSGSFGFATTPYKDSPLFYNLIANRDFENMIKPTSPAAQRAIKEASRRRTSTSLTFASSASMVSKNATFPTSHSFSKGAIFDGFEDDDERGFDIDILSPKTSVKKLSLKSFKQASAPSHRHNISFSSSTQNVAENGFNDAESSEPATRTGTAESRGGQSENGSPAKPTAAEEVHGILNANERTTGVPLPSQLLNQKRRSGPDPPLLRDGFEHKSGVLCTRAGYYVEPSVDMLDKLMDENGNCCVNGLVIGRHGHGEIRFTDVVNVAGANIDEIVHFRHKEVVVYPDDTNKPPLGTGLNCPALVCLHRVWPIDKATKDPVKYPPKLLSMGYEDNLRRACQRLNADFISYNPETGVWTFKVPHFSKYSCDIEEAESENAEALASSAAVPSLPHPPTGLGGAVQPQKPYTATTAAAIQKMSALQGTGYDSFSTNEGKYQWAKPPAINADEDTLPLFRNRNRGSQSTIENTSMVKMTSDASHSAFLGGGGDVEHNPLTPSDSNDSDNSDWVVRARSPLTQGNSDGQYESILADKSVYTSAVQMMKSALMEEGDGIEEMEIQPPSKKFRSPPTRPKNTNARSIEINISAMKQRKSFMELKQRKHGPPVSSLVTLPEKTEKIKEIRAFGTNYVTAIDRRPEVPITTRRKEDLFAKLSLHSTNGTRYKAMPRVTFGLFGTYLTVSNMSKPNPRIFINKMRSYNSQARDPMHLMVLEEQLKKQMSRTTPLVEDQIDVLWKSRLQTQHNEKSGLLYHEIMMWELFQILWPVNESDGLDYLQTRDNIANWFTKYCNQLFPMTLGKDPHKSILGLLKMGRREDACETAVKLLNPYLALLMSQSALEKVTCSNCEEQLDVWKEAEGLNFLAEDMKIMYRLCAGNTILDTIDLGTMTTSEWLQHFALYLWYCCPSHVPVYEAVLSFQQLLKSDLAARTDLTEEEISRVAFPSVCDSSIPNLCVQLLKLYSFDGYPLRNVLDPDAYSSDGLDYKLTWLLMIHLRCNYYKIYNDHFASIATSFSNQLEQVGLFPWAIYVMSKAKDCTAYQKALVERNLGTWGTVKDETFLRKNSLVTSFELLYAARVMREAPDSRTHGKVWYLFKSGNLQKSFDELQKMLTVDIISCKGTVNSLMKLMTLFKTNPHKIRNWQNRGSFIWDMLQLLKMRTGASDRVMAQTEEGLTQAQLFSVANAFLKSFVQFKPLNENECALCMELAVIIQKIVTELMINNSDVGKNIGLTNVSALFDLPVPKDYKDELRYFVNAWLK